MNGGRWPIIKLAILGGQPVRRAPWPTWPPDGEGAKPYLSEVLSSHRWTIRGWYTGQKSKQTVFAERFAAFNEVRYCGLTASGSASLLVALETCDVGAGDEVIIPAYTWIATGIAVTNVNAIPVLVDVDPKTGCIDPAAVKAAITPRTRAIMPVHLHCAVADMGELMAIADKHSLFVIEDCAQAHGARLKGKSVGTFGHVGAFSMNQEKVLCCGEGGAVITNDEDLFKRFTRLRTDGSGVSSKPPVVGRYEFEDTGGLMGANYCMSDFQAAVLMSELEFLEERNRRRERNAGYLNENLSRLGGLVPIESTAGTSERTYFKYAIRRLPDAFNRVPTPRLCAALSAELNFTVEQTECQPLHKNPLYCPATKRRHQLGEEYLRRIDVSNLSFPSAESHYDNTLVFHHRILLAEQRDLDDIVEAFAKVQDNVGELVGRD